MKKYILTGLIIVGLLCFYKYTKEDLKIRCTSTSFEYINYCMQRGDLYPQEQYDFYYNIAANNPKMEIIIDDNFYYGFILANDNCSHNSQLKPCKAHNKQVMKDLEAKCAFFVENAHRLCTKNYFSYSLPNKKNIILFIKIMNNEIKKDKKEYGTTILSCVDSLKEFYNKIPTEFKGQVPIEVQTACSD